MAQLGCSGLINWIELIGQENRNKFKKTEKIKKKKKIVSNLRPPAYNAAMLTKHSVESCVQGQINH
jgi:DNA recombination-dependent growth factor C